MISGHPLMWRFRSQFQNAPTPGRRSTSRPLHHQRHGMGFVEKAKPSSQISGAGIGRIKKHAARTRMRSDSATNEPIQRI